MSEPIPVLITGVGGRSVGHQVLQAVQLAGKFPGDYAPITADTCSASTVAPGGNCTVTLTFTPTAKGARAATLTVIGTTKAPLNIAVSGTGQ